MNLTDRWQGRSGEEACLTLIVGASPLPNLITALALRPATVALICSKETKHGVDRLGRALRVGLKRMGIDLAVKLFGAREYLLIEDAYNPSVIARGMAPYAPQLGRGILSYTGGTKTLATHIHAQWSNHGGTPERACYLADRHATLIFDCGKAYEIPPDVEIDVRALADLSGLEMKESGAKEVSTGQTLQTREGLPEDRHLQAILDAVSSESRVATDLCAVASREAEVDGIVSLRAANLEDAEKGWRAEPGDIVPALPVLDVSLGGRKLKKWVKFLRGDWLDAAAGRFLSQAGERASSSVKRRTYWDINAKLERSGRQFQLDACQVAGARLYAVSCTTDLMGRDLAKLKIFEVIERARQLGGDLARVAVLNLHPDPLIAELEGNVEEIWVGDRPTPRVFGISHLRAWHAGELDSLVAWLES